MRYSSFSYVICCFFSTIALLYTLSLGAVQVWASTTVTPFSLGGKTPQATPQQAPAPAQESTKQASPAAKPLFVKEEQVKPKAEESAPAAKPLFVKEGDIKPEAPAPAQEGTKQASPAAKPLFVKEEQVKPKAEESAPAAKPLFVKEGDIKPEAPAPAQEGTKPASSAVKPLFVKEEQVKPKAEESAPAAKPLFVKEGDIKPEAPAPAQEGTKPASPAAKPLFVKEGDIKPEAEKSSASKVEGGSSVTSFAIPLAPAPKKPGKAIVIPSTKDVLALTAFISDGQIDSCLRAIALQASPLVAVRLESMGGQLASWKTKDVKASAQGVLALYQGESLVNANDASFSLNVTQPTELDLCVQDSGALKDAQTKFRVIFFHADGTRTYAVVVR